MKNSILKILRYLAIPFVFFPFLFNIYSIIRKAKKHERDNTRYPLEKRIALLYKAATKFIFITGCTIRSDGFSKISNKPVLFIANHKSMIDSVVLWKLLYKADVKCFPMFVAKKEINDSFILGRILTLADAIIIDRNNLRSVYNAYLKQSECIKNNRSVFIFPEGTREYSDSFLPFLPAALKIGYENFLSIVPIVIQGSQGIMDFKANVKNKKKIIQVQVLKLVPYQNYINIKQEGFANTLHDNMHEAYKKLCDQLLPKKQKEE